MTGDRNSAGKGLIDDAIALGEPQKRLELIVGRAAFQFEDKPDGSEANRRLAVAGNSQSAAEIKVALGAHRSRHWDLERRRHGSQRHPGARDERLKQHVAGAGKRPRPSCRRMQARSYQGAAGLHRAGDLLIIQRSLRVQRDERRLGLVPVAGFERLLRRAKVLSIHSPAIVRSTRPRPE